MTSCHDVFAALQTPPGRGAIAVISVSGQGAPELVAGIFDPVSGGRNIAGGTLRLGTVVCGGEAIDQAILAKRGDSFELSLHGGSAVVRKCLSLLSESGATVLGWGEGPIAFESAHPKWDNPAIGEEMLSHLSAARGPMAVSTLTQQWSAGLSELASGKPEAGRLRKAADRLGSANKLLIPPEVVIAGPPNAGKSQLANALVGRPVSIVHGSAGTTRDWVRELALLDGVAVWLTDTAGLWQTQEAIDIEAVNRAGRCINQADLTILLAEGAVPSVPSWLKSGRLLTVSSKCDLCRPEGKPDAIISALTGQGLEKLRALILKSLGLGGFDPAEPTAFTSRQAELLQQAARAVERGDRQAEPRLLRQLLTGHSSE